METALLAPEEKNWKIKIRKEERNKDSLGKYKLDPKLCKIREEAFSKLPKTEEEAREQNTPFFDGMSTCFIGEMNENAVNIEIMPIRYSYRLATIELSNKISTENLTKISPNIIQVAILIAYKREEDGKIIFLSQLRGGKTVGTGKVLLQLAGGGLEEKHLSKKNPFFACLEDESSEEVGYTLKEFEKIKCLGFNEEKECGCIRLLYFKKLPTNKKEILEAFLKHCKKLEEEKKEGEVSALIEFSLDEMLEKERISLENLLFKNHKIWEYDKATQTLSEKKKDLQFSHEGEILFIQKYKTEVLKFFQE